MRLISTLHFMVCGVFKLHLASLTLSYSDPEPETDARSSWDDDLYGAIEMFIPYYTGSSHNEHMHAISIPPFVVLLQAVPRNPMQANQWLYMRSSRNAEVGSSRASASTWRFRWALQPGKPVQAIWELASL